MLFVSRKWILLYAHITLCNYHRCPNGSYMYLKCMQDIIIILLKKNKKKSFTIQYYNIIIIEYRRRFIIFYFSSCTRLPISWWSCSSSVLKASISNSILYSYVLNSLGILRQYHDLWFLLKFYLEKTTLKTTPKIFGIGRIAASVNYEVKTTLDCVENENNIDTE